MFQICHMILFLGLSLLRVMPNDFIYRFICEQCGHEAANPTSLRFHKKVRQCVIIYTFHIYQQDILEKIVIWRFAFNTKCTLQMYHSLQLALAGNLLKEEGVGGKERGKTQLESNLSLSITAILFPFK